MWERETDTFSPPFLVKFLTQKMFSPSAITCQGYYWAHSHVVSRYLEPSCGAGQYRYRHSSLKKPTRRNVDRPGSPLSTLCALTCLLGQTGPGARALLDAWPCPRLPCRSMGVTPSSPQSGRAARQRRVDRDAVVAPKQRPPSDKADKTDARAHMLADRLELHTAATTKAERKHSQTISHTYHRAGSKPSARSWQVTVLTVLARLTVLAVLTNRT